MGIISLQLGSILAVIVACGHCVNGVPLSDFYTFGNLTEDSTLPRNDDGSTSPIPLRLQFPFFGEDRENVFVS